MSEDKKYTLTEYVFRDIRTAPEFEKQGDNIDPINMIDIYRDMKKSCDAEKWNYAIESYKNYPCFRNSLKTDNSNNDEAGYVFDSEGLRYEYRIEGKTETIRIFADTLTGPIGIKFYADKWKDSKKIDETKKSELLSALRDFCSVAYTIGNFSPVMKNKGTTKNKAGAVVADSCWHKLGRFHRTDKQYKFKNIIDSKWDDNHKKRKADNMFAVFPHNLSGREIVNRLMLNDYYDDNYNLILTEEPNYYADQGVDEYIRFLRLVTTLIIKRGIRIYNALPDDMKKSE